jgi:uncharacterized membrane protein
MNSKTKFLSIIMLLVLSVLAVAAVVSAVPVTVNSVEVNGKVLTDDKVRIYDRTDKLDVSVDVESPDNVDNVRIRAEVTGFEDELIEEVSDLFDMKSGRVYNEDFSLNLPSNMDRDNYTLTITVTGRGSSPVVQEYSIEVDTARHSLAIKDINFHPQGAVKAGSSLVATVKVENMGQLSEDVDVSISIPQIGVGDESTIDDLKANDDKSTEELWVRIDKCTAPGKYEAVIKAESDHATVEEKVQIEIVDGGLCAPQKKTVLTIGSAINQVSAGKAAIFPVTLANEGTATEAYSIVVEGASSWATAQVTPETVVQVNAGETATAFVYVTPDEKAEAGQHTFTLTVKSGEETLKQVALNVEVLNGANSAVKALEIGLIVLVIVLVVLGLIIGFNKIKANKEDEEGEEGQTYY